MKMISSLQFPSMEVSHVCNLFKESSVMNAELIAVFYSLRCSNSFYDYLG